MEAPRDLPAVQLEIVRGQANQRIHRVASAVFLIGGAADCDLVLADPQFGEVHSYLFVSPGRVAMRHLGCGPALCVDGREVAWARLGNADRVQIGAYEIQVRIEWPEFAAGANLPGDEFSPRYVMAGDESHVTERLLRDLQQHGTKSRLSLYDDNCDGHCHLKGSGHCRLLAMRGQRNHYGGLSSG